MGRREIMRKRGVEDIRRNCKKIVFIFWDGEEGRLEVDFVMSLVFRWSCGGGRKVCSFGDGVEIWVVDIVCRVVSM